MVFSLHTSLHHAMHSQCGDHKSSAYFCHFYLSVKKTFPREDDFDISDLNQSHPSMRSHPLLFSDLCNVVAVRVTDRENILFTDSVNHNDANLNLTAEWWMFSHGFSISSQLLFLSFSLSLLLYSMRLLLRAGRILNYWSDYFHAVVHSDFT